MSFETKVNISFWEGCDSMLEDKVPNSGSHILLWNQQTKTENQYRFVCNKIILKPSILAYLNCCTLVIVHLPQRT